MSHPFGDLISQHLHRKHGLSQAKLAEGILQDPSLIGKMCKGERLHGVQARERVCAIIAWLCQQAVLTTVAEANGLLTAAGMAALRMTEPREAQLLQQLHGRSPAPTLPMLPHVPVTTRPRTNLPVSLTSFVGRVEAITEVAQLVANCRLVMLTGAGGVGKTRLALEVGKAILDSAATQSTHLKSQIPQLEFPDGVWFVDLAPLTDPAAIPQRILDLWRVPEQPEHSPLESLIAYLRAKAALLLLDNCEHLIAACAALAETLLQQCPQLSLLATSREALNIGGETLWRVPSLTHPRAGPGWDGQAATLQSQFTSEALSRFEAVTLFVERAAVRQPGFALTLANAPAIAHICSRLDGIPLALEMAAARVNAFTIEELAIQLDGASDRRFQLLTSGARTAPYRHQTLRATLDWSYGLLTPAEQRLLVRLSVFTGGWTLAAAEAVASATLDGLAQMVEKSLVLADQQAEQTRYRLLETVRQFAAEQGALEEQAYRQAQAQHSRYYLTLLAAQEQRIQGPQQRGALDTLRADFENIKVAWRWAIEQCDFALLAQATHAFFLYCEVRGQFREGASLFAAATAELTAASATNRLDLQLLLGRVLARLGACEVLVASYESAVRPLEQALDYVTTDWERAFTLAYLGHADMGRGEWSAGQAKLHQSLALSRHCQDPTLTAQALYLLNKMTSTYVDAIRGCEESLALWRQMGRPDRIVEVLNRVALWAFCLGDYAKAIVYWQENIERCTALGMQDALAWARNGLGRVAWCRGDLSAAQSYLQEAAELYRAIGVPTGVGYCLATLALVVRSGGDVEQAVAVAHQAVAIERDTEDRMMLVFSLTSLGAALIGAGEFAAARQALKEAFQQLLVAQYPFFTVIAFYYFVELLVLESRTTNLPLPLERHRQALALLSCVRSQTATWQIYRDKAAQLQAEIEATVPAEMRITAIARGQACTLEELVSSLLREQAETRVDDPKNAR